MLLRLTIAALNLNENVPVPSSTGLENINSHDPSLKRVHECDGQHFKQNCILSESFNIFYRPVWHNLLIPKLQCGIVAVPELM